MSEVERFIRAVRENPVIYDPSHPDHKMIRKRDEVWYKIAEKFENYDTDWKKKWKNLKDTYMKYLKTEKPNKPDKATKRYKRWPWAPDMEFLRPFCKITKATAPTNSTYKNWMELPDDVYSDDSSEEFKPESLNENKTCDEEEQSSIKHGSGQELVEQEIQHIDVDRLNKSEYEVGTTIPTPKQKTSESYSKFNDIELILMGYAKTIKKFSAKRQAMVKFKFSKILMEEELAQLEEDENFSGPSAKRKCKDDTLN